MATGQIRNCCPHITCVSTICVPATRTCERNDGTTLTLESDWRRMCAQPSCPPECPRSMTAVSLNCPVSRNTHSSGFVPRILSSPFQDASGRWTCTWQDCPDYEPCNDEAIPQIQRDCNN